jgi:hypothetical protein
MCGLPQQHVGDGMIVQHSLKKQIETGMNVQRENFPHLNSCSCCCCWFCGNDFVAVQQTVREDSEENQSAKRLFYSVTNFGDHPHYWQNL